MVLSNDTPPTAPDPPDPDHEIAGVRHEQAFHVRSFVGRARLLAEIDAWIEASGAGAGLLLTGGPGAGKSAIAAEIARRHEGRGALLHMIRSHRSPRRFVPALISQAARAAGVRFGTAAYVGDTDDLREALVRALDAVRAKLGRAVLVLDGLDELDVADAGLAFLPAALPDGVRVVLTCRPDAAYLAAVRARLPGVAEQLVPPLAEADVRALAAARLAGIAGADHVDLGALSDRAGGNPLFVGRALTVLARELAAGDAPRLDRLPVTLAGVLDDVYREIAGKSGARPPGEEDGSRARLAQILAVAREPMTIADLAEVASLDAPISLEACRDRVHEMSRFLLDAGGERFALWHHGLAEHVRARVLGDAGVRALEAAFAAWLARRPDAGYALRHRVAHLLAIGHAAEAAALLLDGRTLEMKAEAGLVFDLVAELGDVARALPHDARERALLEIIAGAIRLHGHFVARHPEALFQTVHEACASDAAASAWAQRWRERKRAAEQGFAWLRAVRPSPSPAAAALLSVMRGHTRDVLAIAVSPAGDRIASAAEDGTLRVWDARTGRGLLTLHTGARRALSAAFSPDGRQVACGTDDGRVRMWDARDGATATDLRKHEGAVWALAFSPGGDLVASGGRDHALRVWRRDGADLWRRDVEDVLTAVAFSPDGERLAVTKTRPCVTLFSARTGEPIHRVEGFEDTPWSVEFSPDGARLAVAAADGSVRVFDAALQPLAELDLPDERLFTCAFSPDGRRVACGGTGRRVHLWTPGSDAAPVALPAHGGWVNAVAFTPDGESVVSGSADRTVRVFRAGALPERSSATRVTVAAFSNRGRHLAVGFHDGSVELWDAATGAVERRLAAHTRAVVALAFSPDDRLVASASRDGSAAVHRIDGRAIARLTEHEGAVTGVAFTPDGGRVLTGASDHAVRLWTLLGARRTHRFDHGEAVTALDVSADGRRLAAGARGGEVRVWDLGDRVEIARFTVAGDGPGRAGEPDPRQHDVARVQLSADGTEITVTARSGPPTHWQVDTGARASRGAADPAELFTVAHADETEIRRAAGGALVACYPLALPNLRPSPSGRAWVAWEGAHVHLFALEQG